MKKILIGFTTALFLFGMVGLVNAAMITLDADSAATGSNLQTSPLETALGTISFVGEIRDRDGDEEFLAAGALGDVFDIGGTANGSWAQLSFSFDVSSISFIYGGNYGSINLLARDISGVTVDSFYQSSTYSGQSAGPVTLSGVGIRSLYWEDPGNEFAALDNIVIDDGGSAPVPEPSTILLMGAGLLGLVGYNRKRFSKKS